MCFFVRFNNDKKDDNNGNNNDDDNDTELRRGYNVKKYTRHKTKNQGGDMELDIQNNPEIFRSERTIFQTIHY